MLIGVISFSFATGSLSSIMQNYDQANAKLQERITILNRIYKEYYLPLDLYQKLKQAVKYDFNKDKNDINSFVSELPHKLKLEVSLYIHEATYKKIDAFRSRSSAFIAWICPLLKPNEYPKDQYVFFEGDDVTNIFFLSGGKAGFVLPKYKNTTYIEVDEGDTFGIIDIVASVLNANYDLDSWYGHLDVLTRQFTLMSLKKCECMCLSLQDLQRMKHEFREVYSKLMEDSCTRLRRALKLKLKAIRICEEKEESWSTNRSQGEFSSINMEESQLNLAGQIGFTQDENIDLKADDLNFQIQAVQLHKVDEVSVESSDYSKSSKSSKSQQSWNKSSKNNSSDQSSVFSENQ